MVHGNRIDPTLIAKVIFASFECSDRRGLADRREERRERERAEVREDRRDHRLRALEAGGDLQHVSACDGAENSIGSCR